MQQRLEQMLRLAQGNLDHEDTKLREGTKREEHEGCAPRMDDSLGDGMKKAKGVSSGAILGNGNIGLILDPEGLFDLSETAVGAKPH